jgi:hypothetical protein
MAFPSSRHYYQVLLTNLVKSLMGGKAIQEPMSIGGRVRDGIHLGPLSGLLSPSIERMIGAGVVQALAQGQSQPSWQAAPTVMVEGLMRVCTRTPEGREWTLRYVQAGDTVHFAPISGADSSLHVQALIDSIFLVVDREALSRWMSVDAEVASAVAAGRPPASLPPPSPS